MVRRARAFALTTTLAAAIAAAAGGTATAHTPRTAGRVVVILVDDVSIDLIARIQALQAMAAQGAAGVMTATRGIEERAIPVAAVATLSAGAPAVAPDPEEHPRLVQPGEPHEEAAFGAIGDLYATRTGEDPGDAAVLYPDVALLARLNADPSVGAAPGLLGETLRDAGIRTAAVGSSDLPGDPLRPAAILSMDARGTVSSGDVTTGTGGEEPLPIRTDPEELSRAVAEALTTSRFVVVDWGETSRLDRLAAELAPDAPDPFAEPAAAELRELRNASLLRLNDLIDGISANLDLEHDVLAMVAPTPSSAEERAGRPLAPVIVSGGPVTHGELTSDTTRRDGVVSSVDLAPTILDWFGVAVPEAMRGTPFRIRQASFPLANASGRVREASETERARLPVLGAVLLAWVLALLAAVVALERRLRSLSAPRPRPRPAPLARTLLLGSAFLPLALLLEPLLPQTGVTVVVAAEILALALVAGWIVARASGRTVPALVLIGAATLAAVIVDTVLGSPLAEASLAGTAPATEASGPGPFFGGAAVAGAIACFAPLPRLGRRDRMLSVLLMVVVAVGVGVLAIVARSPLVATVGLPALLMVGVAGRPRAEVRSWAFVAGGAVAVAVSVVVLAQLGVLLGQAQAAADASFPGTDAPAAPAALADLVVHHGGRALRFALTSGWTVAILVAAAATWFALGRPRELERDLPPPRKPPGRDPVVFVAAMTFLAATAVALLVAVEGAAAAAALAGGAAVVSAGSAIERARPRRRG